MYICMYVCVCVGVCVCLCVCECMYLFVIYTMRQVHEDNLTIKYVIAKKIDVSFSCIWPFIDKEFRHNMVKVVCGCT